MLRRRCKALAGTREAYQSCGSCGHARIRHTCGGQCASVRVVAVLNTHGGDSGTTTLTRCTCTRFTERTSTR